MCRVYMTSGRASLTRSCERDNCRHREVNAKHAESSLSMPLNVNVLLIAVETKNPSRERGEERERERDNRSRPFDAGDNPVRKRTRHALAKVIAKA